MEEYQKITDLPELTTPDNGDLLEIVDVSDQTDDTTGSSKKITITNLFSSIISSIALKLTTSIFATEHNSTTGVHTSATVTTLKATGAEINTGTEDAKIVTPKAIKDSILYNLPQGSMLNGKIVTSVSSNNLTVAIKTLAGTDPSTTDPVYVRIGNTVRTITSALSITRNAGTNWMNAGSVETATFEIDYFVYLGYNATDGVTIGFSRIPYARVYGDFSTTTTNDKHCCISTITNATSTDVYENVGRFNASNSGSASFNWSIPATSIIINRPIFNTRRLQYNPVFTAEGSMTLSTITNEGGVYQVVNDRVMAYLGGYGTTGGTPSNALYGTLPFEFATSGLLNYAPAGTVVYFEGGATDAVGVSQLNSGNQGKVTVSKPGQGNYSAGSTRGFRANLIYFL